MTIDEKVRRGLLALSAVSTVVVAAHVGHFPAVKPPFLDELGGIFGA